LEGGWSDEGLSCASADGILARLLAVQNTDLGTRGLAASKCTRAQERVGSDASDGFSQS
jgi:hypothetical protein